MKVGYLQYDVKHERDWNIDRIEKALQERNYDLLVLPELSMCGYLFESRADLLRIAEIVPDGDAVQRMMQLSKQYACTIVFGLAEKEGKCVFNTAVVVSRGKYMGKYRKMHLSDFEKKLFDKGTENCVFEVDGTKLGVQICFDLWFPEVAREQVRMGAEVFCALANFGGALTCQIAQVRAIENLTPLVLCNRIGAESIPDMEAEFLGKSVVIDAYGNPVSQVQAHAECADCCDIVIPTQKANVICSDFLEEMAVHYNES